MVFSITTKNSAWAAPPEGAAPAGGAPPGGPPPGPLASAKIRIRIASALDKQNCHKQADYLIKLALHTSQAKKPRK